MNSRAAVRPVEPRAASTRDDIARAVREELRAALMFLPEPPHAPPHNLSIERSVISSAWVGSAIPAELKPEHFFAPLHAELFRYLLTTKEPNFRDAAAVLSSHAASRISDDIEALIAWEPAHFDLRPHAGILISFYRRRIALQHIARAEALLRVPSSDTLDAEQELTLALSTLNAPA